MQFEQKILKPIVLCNFLFTCASISRRAPRQGLTESVTKGNVHKKKLLKSGQADRLGWPPPPAPMKRSGKCEIFWLWLLTLVYDYIWPKTNFTQKIFFDHRKFLWRLLETLHDIHGFSCLGAVKKAIKIHQKCIFQPLHNGVKSVLGIKESYSMGKMS